MESVYSPAPTILLALASKRARQVPGFVSSYVVPSIKERTLSHDLALKAIQEASFPASHAAVVRYQPLAKGDIRLVDFGAHGQGRALVHACLADKPDYIAISYCWGSENCFHRFQINGQVMILTSSLYRIFLELLCREYRGKVWADGICIDQNNNDEKAVQIPEMGQIYRNAKTVFAWLGSGPRSQHLEMSTIYNVSRKSFGDENENRPVWHLPFSQIIEDDDLLPPVHSTQWNELAEMFNSAYFSRLWTLQESIVSGSLVIGFGGITVTWEQLYELQRSLHSLNFEDFWRAHDLAWQGATDPLTRIRNIEYCRRQFRDDCLDMSTLLGEARAKSSTIPQDKVFAFYSLMSPQFRAEVPVDLNISTQRVFIRAAKALIKHEPRGLIPLSYAENESKISGLPSWVFDLTAPNLAWLMAGFCGYDAGRAQKYLARPEVAHGDNDDTLGLLGVGVDVVSSVVCPIINDFDVTAAHPQYWEKARDAIQWISGCISAIRSALSLSEQQALLKFSRVLVCDRPMYETAPHKPFTDTTAGKLQMVLRKLRQAADQQPWDWGRAEEYYKAVVAFQRRRSFFITRTGYLGIGPPRVRIGDQIVVLYGGDVPFAVRKRQLGPYYGLLGECYVDGLMEGQAVADRRKTRERDQVFVFD